MIEALIGSIIALIATGGIALMAEVFTASRDESLPRPLSAYEEDVLNVTSSAHGVTPKREDLEDWLQEKLREGL